MSLLKKIADLEKRGTDPLEVWNLMSRLRHENPDNPVYPKAETYAYKLKELHRWMEEMRPNDPSNKKIRFHLNRLMESAMKFWDPETGMPHFEQLRSDFLSSIKGTPLEYYWSILGIKD
jgi:hypothetical protein